MNRRLVRDSAIYGLGTVLSRSITFLLVPIYTHFLALSEYGALSLLNNVQQAFSVCCALGISSAAQRFYFDTSAETTHGEAVFGNAVALSLLAPLAALLLLAPPVALVTNALLPTLPFVPFVLLSLLIAALTPIHRLVLAYYRVRRLALRFVTFSLAFFLVQTTMIFVAVVMFRGGLIGQLSAQLASVAVFAAVALVTLLRYSRPRINNPLSPGLLLYGLPLVPFYLLTWAHDAMGRFALASRFGLDLVGLYSLAALFAGVLPLAASALDNALQPHFFKAAQGSQSANPLGTLVGRFVVGFGILGLAIVAIAPYLVSLIAPPRYLDSSIYVGPLVLATWLYVASYPTIWSLGHLKQTFRLTAIQFLATAITGLTLYLLVIRAGYGIMGVAAAMVAGSLTMTSLGWLVATRSGVFAPHWKRLAAGCAILLAAGIALQMRPITPDSAVELAFRGAVLTIGSVVAAMTAKLYPIRMVSDLLKR